MWLSRLSMPFVMAGLDPAIHAFSRRGTFKTWMPGTGPGMTKPIVPPN